MASTAPCCLIPTWALFLVWVIAAGLTVEGVFTNELVAPALLGGLVLIVMLIGFTVMQHAFTGGIGAALSAMPSAARWRSSARATSCGTGTPGATTSSPARKPNSFSG